MSYAVPPVDVSGLVVGNATVTALADWTGKVSTGSPLGAKAGRATVRMKNESNFGLLYSLGRHSGHLGAGEWSDLVLDGQNSVSVSAEYQLVGASPNLLLATVFEPGEPVPPSPTLGNSSVQGISSLTTKIQVNTTGGDQADIEFGPDPHSLSDWELVSAQNGNFLLHDNKNVRNPWVANLADGTISFPQGVSGNLVIPVNAGFYETVVDTTSANRDVMQFHDNKTGADWFFIVFTTGDFVLWDNKNGRVLQSWQLAANTTTIPATIAQIAGQATAGSFGVPMIVAQASATISVITLVTVLSFTPGATGLYRINASFNANNGGTNKPGIGLNWTGGKSGLATAATMYVDTVPMDQTNTVTGNRDFNMVTKSFYASSSGAITLTYINNGAASANDFITATLERLS